MDDNLDDLTVLAVRQDAVRTAVQIHHGHFPTSDGALLGTADRIAAFILEGKLPERASLSGN